METALGSFEGRKIDIGAIKLTGSATERVGKLALGEEVYVVGRAVVSRIEHGETKDGFVRVHKAEVVSLALIEPEDGKRMLAEGQRLADERFGVVSLFRHDLLADAAKKAFGDRATVTGNTITLHADENGEIVDEDDAGDAST